MTTVTAEPTTAMEREALPRRSAYAAGPALVWLAGFAVFGALRAGHGLRAAGLWGLLILSSFVCWGAALTRTLSPRQRFGWGFHGAVGTAMTLATFGLVAAIRLVSVGSIVTWCVAGPIALGFTRWRDPSPLPAYLRWQTASEARSWLALRFARPRPIPFYVGAFVLGVAAALLYVSSLTDTSFNVWDDNMAYRTYARQFLDLGTLLDSFSYRRIGAYGGQSLLHAFVLACTDRDRVHVIDDGLAVVLNLALVLGFRSNPGRRARAGMLAAGLLLMTLPYTPHNTASANTGVLFFLALYRLFDDPGFESAKLRSNAVLAGLFVAAVCTLRQNYISAAFAFPGMMYLGLLLFRSTRPRVEWLKEGAAVAGVAALALVPWMIMSFAATGTPFYPVVKGYIRADYGLAGRATLGELFRWTVENLFYFKPIATIALFFMAGFALPFRPRNRATHAFLFSSIASFAMMMWFFQTFDQTDSIARYYFAFTVAFACAATLRAVTEASQSRGGESFAAGAMAIVAVGMHFVMAKDTVKDLYIKRVSAWESFWAATGPSLARTSLDELYERVQAAVPTGEKILVLLDHTYLLDGKRNSILDYDHPGAMGPKGGPPDFQGPEAFATWMRDNGVRYIAFQMGPGSPEYNRSIYERRAQESGPKNGRGGFYKKQSAYVLDFMNVLDALEKSRSVIFREGEFRVLDLQTLAH